MGAPVRLQFGADGISSFQVHDRSPLSIAAPARYGAGRPMIGTVLMLFFGLP
jgi:hypothetical protein